MLQFLENKLALAAFSMQAGRAAGGPGTAMRVSETFGASAHVVRGVPLIDYLLPHQHSHDATNLSTKDKDKVRANELI